MITLREICVLVNYSPKRENILGRMQENFDETLILRLINFWRSISCGQLVGLYVLLVFKRLFTAIDCY